MRRLLLGAARVVFELLLGAPLYVFCLVVILRDLFTAHRGYWRGFLKRDPRGKARQG